MLCRLAPEVSVMMEREWLSCGKGRKSGIGACNTPPVKEARFGIMGRAGTA